ncbi:hypothetical protein WJX73_004523 [Symbiochloris irregularis]|uniref:Uncharacterized protein n=1 Tax=Symbiochloris irregularis TaxID=706552 RepID=A0AAW1NV21_9CHLO
MHEGIAHAGPWSTANTGSLQRSQLHHRQVVSAAGADDDDLAEPAQPDNRLPEEPWERRDPTDDDSDGASGSDDDGSDQPDFMHDDLSADGDALDPEDDSYAYDERGVDLSGEDDESSQDEESSSSDDEVVIQVIQRGQADDDDELPDFVPVEALKWGTDPRDGAPVHISYKTQFAATGAGGSVAAAPPRKAPSSKPKKGKGRKYYRRK